MSLALVCVLLCHQVEPVAVQISAQTYEVKPEASISLSTVMGYQGSECSFLSVDGPKLDTWLKSAVATGAASIQSSPKLNSLSGMPATICVGNEKEGMSMGMLASVSGDNLAVSAMMVNRMLKKEEMLSKGWSSTFLGPISVTKGRTLILLTGEEGKPVRHLTTLTARLLPGN